MVDFAKIACIFILMFFTVCTFKDVCVHTTSEKLIPIPKTGLGSSVGPTLKFLYCYSCGYRKLFEDYSNLVRQKYPDISVEGGNYDPPEFQMFLAKTFGLGKMILIICILSGVNIFTKLGADTPSWWTWCVDNKLYSCLMIFFMCNAIEGHLVSTGAFEIMLNDIPVWSKLETGRIPQPPELFQILDNHIMIAEIATKSDFPK